MSAGEHRGRNLRGLRPCEEGVRDRCRQTEHDRDGDDPLAHAAIRQCRHAVSDHQQARRQDDGGIAVRERAPGELARDNSHQERPARQQRQPANSRSRPQVEHDPPAVQGTAENREQRQEREHESKRPARVRVSTGELSEGVNERREVRRRSPRRARVLQLEKESRGPRTECTRSGRQPDKCGAAAVRVRAGSGEESGADGGGGHKEESPVVAVLQAAGHSGQGRHIPDRGPAKNCD